MNANDVSLMVRNVVMNFLHGFGLVEKPSKKVAEAGVMVRSNVTAGRNDTGEPPVRWDT